MSSPRSVTELIEESYSLERAGDVAAALERAQQALTLAQILGEPNIIADAMLRVAGARYRLGQYDAVRALAKQVLTLATPNAPARAHALLFLGNCLIETGALAEAEQLFHRAAAKSIRDGNYVFLLEQERALAFPLVAAYLNHPDSELAALANALVTHLERVPPPPLQIFALGQFQVRQMNRAIPDPVWRRRRAGELFRLLLVSPGRSLSRDEIVEALWRDPAPASPALFHQATSALRRALEPELPDKFPSRYLAIEEGRVTLHLPRGSQVDFEEFERNVEKQAWETALAIYQGELFPGDRYADWTVIPRERLQRLYLRALLIVAHRRDQAGQHREALDLCYRILEIEPWQEDAVLIGMRACLAFNDRAGALRLYRELERALREELGTTPQKELQTLCQSLL